MRVCMWACMCVFVYRYVCVCVCVCVCGWVCVWVWMCAECMKMLDTLSHAHSHTHDLSHTRVQPCLPITCDNIGPGEQPLSQAIGKGTTSPTNLEANAARQSKISVLPCLCVFCFDTPSHHFRYASLPYTSLRCTYLLPLWRLLLSPSPDASFSPQHQ